MKNLFLSILFILVIERSNSQTFTYSGAAVAIPDLGGTFTEIPLTISTNNQVMNSTWGVVSVSINITHTAVGDLFIFLGSPTGTFVDLSILRGGTSNNFPNTVFNSSSGTTIAAAGTPYGAGPYAPEVHLGNFNLGASSTGIWKLYVRDYIGGDVGTVNSFSITFSGTPATPQLWMGTGVCTLNDCGPLKFYDYGGPSANYPNGFTTPVIQTICTNSTTNTCLRATFNANTVFNGSCANDYLDVYYGTASAPTYFGSFCNGTFGATTITSNQGCMTFSFRSNNTGNASGWNADISCVTGCAAISVPGNDNCSGAITLTTSGTNYYARGCDMAGVANAISTAGTVSPSNCGWSSSDNTTFYLFNVASGTPQPVQVDVTSVTCAGGGSAVQLALFDNNCNTVGLYGSNYHGCASGSGSVSLTSTTNPLPSGSYILAVDGSSGANCNFTFNGAVVLPIGLKDFAVSKKNNSSIISWSTVSETNNNHFEIQHSIDAKDFETIEKIFSKGDSNSEINYETKHLSPKKGMNYYRIIQVDNDGKKTYFPIRQLDFSNEVNSFVTYTNNDGYLYVDLNSEIHYDASLELINMEGKSIGTKNIVIVEGENHNWLNISNLNDGVYLLIFRSPNNVIKKKVSITKTN